MSQLLAERDWTDSDLAEDTGLPRVRINRIKNRRARTTIVEALLICQSLGLPVEKVFWLE